MQYTYCFANASLVLRLVAYLSEQVSIGLISVTVVYLVDRWVVRIKLQSPLSAPLRGNFLAFLQEIGYPFSLSNREKNALVALEKGATVSAVMSRYHLVIVSHGGLHPEKIESFRTTFTSSLGYCPPSLV